MNIDSFNLYVACIFVMGFTDLHKECFINLPRITVWTWFYDQWLNILKKWLHSSSFIIFSLVCCELNILLFSNLQLEDHLSSYLRLRTFNKSFSICHNPVSVWCLIRTNMCFRLYLILRVETRMLASNLFRLICLLSLQSSSSNTHFNNGYKIQACIRLFKSS